ncbi:MAG: hypothetical protein Q7T55_25480 [Solirubrobacteraceae bacterium]|nr:hypothetical protein [Solirubrobacteraceae bacterium]
MALAVAAAGVGFAVAGSRSVGSEADGLDGPLGLAVLARSPTAADRELREAGYGALVSQGRGSDAKRDELRLLRRRGEEVAVLVATEQPSEPGPGEKTDGVPFGRFKEVCINYATGGLSNIACGDRRAFRRGGIGGISQSAEFGADTTDEEVMDAPDDEPFLDADGKVVPAHFYGLVPNAVARVEQTFSGGLPSAEGPVSGNFYDIVSTHPEAPNRNGDVLWFDRDGKAIPH